jgi:hypothetical protein
VNGFDVIDVDVKNGAKGADWFWQQVWRLPKTRMHVTESGGYHVLLRHHEGLRGSVGRIAPGVDVRADAGYVVWWPAVGLPVANAGLLAEWPDWLLGLAVKKDYQEPSYAPQSSMNEKVVLLLDGARA